MSTHSDPSAGQSDASNGVKKLNPGQKHEVSIEKLTHGGSGLAHIDGMAIFVPRGVPGQKLEVVLTKKKDGYFEAKVTKVLKKSIDEIMPRCSHFGTCGCCTWQNLSYDKQISYKEDIVRDTLEHLTPVDKELRAQLPGRVLKVIPSPQVFNYRNKMELSFGYEHMRVEEVNGKKRYIDENPTLGFHAPGQWSTVLPVDNCSLYDEQLDSLVADVRRFITTSNLPVYNPKTHKGMLRTLLLRRGVQTGEHMIGFVLKAKKKELEPLFQHFMQFSGRSGLKSLMVIENLGMNDRPENPKVHPLVGGNTINERLFDLTFEISPFSFFQTNTLAAEKLYQAIAEGADLSPSDTVLDAYCGMGTIGQYLARFCEKVVGVESHPGAVEDALRSAGKNKIGNISFYKGRTEQVLNQQLKAGGKYNFSTIVVDPPRAGLHPDALKAVIEHGAPKVVYVSCNTATFCRDLGKLLEAGYELRTVQPVDMFPHTPHIETVSVLQKK